MRHYFIENVNEEDEVYASTLALPEGNRLAEKIDEALQRLWEFPNDSIRITVVDK